MLEASRGGMLSPTIGPAMWWLTRRWEGGLKDGAVRRSVAVRANIDRQSGRGNSLEGRSGFDANSKEDV